MSGTVQVLGISSAERPLPRKDQVFELERSQILRVRNGKGTTVRVVSGAVWVTQDGDARDVVLEAGKDFVLDRSGMAVLAPLSEGRVRLVLGDARAAARRALAFLPLGRPVAA